MKAILDGNENRIAGIFIMILALGMLMALSMSCSEVTAAPPTGVTAIDVENSTFSPNADTIKDNATINVTADTGQTLYINIYNSTMDLQYQGLDYRSSRILARVGITAHGTEPKAQFG
jgi:hypothetical protein